MKGDTTMREISLAPEEVDTTITSRNQIHPDWEDRSFPKGTLFECAGCGAIHTPEEWTTNTAEILEVSVASLCNFLTRGVRNKECVYFCRACKDFVPSTSTRPHLPKGTSDGVISPEQKKKESPVMSFSSIAKLWEDFDTVLIAGNREYRGNTPSSIHSDRLKADWLRNKQWLVEYFDDQGRWETPIEGIKGESEFSQFVSNAIYPFLMSGHWVEAKAKKMELSIGFVASVQKLIRLISLEIMTPQELATNQISTSPSPDVPVRYPRTETRSYIEAIRNRKVKGMKVSKYVNRILEIEIKSTHPTPWFPYNLSLNHVRQLQDIGRCLMSEVIDIMNRAQKQQTVVLSINPVDLLCASTYTLGWSSCFNFVTGGSRGGVPSLMKDSVTAIAYQYNKHLSVDGVKVPQKMWRQWVHFDVANVSAIFGRHFPHKSPHAEKIIRAMVARVLSEEMQVPYKWKWKKVGNGDYRLSGNQVYIDTPSARIILPGGKYPQVTAGNGYSRCLSCGTYECTSILCGECLRGEPLDE